MYLCVDQKRNTSHRIRTVLVYMYFTETEFVYLGQNDLLMFWANLYVVIVKVKSLILQLCNYVVVTCKCNVVVTTCTA